MYKILVCCAYAENSLRECFRGTNVEKKQMRSSFGNKMAV